MLIAALTFGLGRWMVEERWIIMFYPNLKDYAPQWAQIYEEKGLDNAQEYSIKMAQKHRIFASILSSDELLFSTLTMPQREHRNMRKNRGMHHPENDGRGNAGYVNMMTARNNFHYINYEYTSDNGNDYLFRFVLPIDGVRTWQNRALFGPLALFITIIALSLVSWFLSRSIIKPIRRLREAVKDLGETSYQTEQLASISTRHDEIGMLARDFNRMGERLQTQLTNQRQLLRDVSHELRSPLARLRIALGLAERQSETEKISPQIWAQLQRECDHLDQLIGEILSLARFDSTEEQSEMINLNALIQETISEHPNLNYRLNAPEEIFVQGWSRWLEKTFSNLLRNAERFNPPDAPLEISLSRDGETAHIRLRDHGAGCDPAILSKLGEPFFRAPGQSIAGYGLGLAIARRAIEQHGGIIRFENAEPHGFVVDITLPTIPPQSH
ncbi:MAG: HAMP domain-containing histidine kinase [Burkholderiales bacterium]|nr:HAMP domain-containing histidine kinase [Burkholderiales bacterium]